MTVIDLIVCAAHSAVSPLSSATPATTGSDKPANIGWCSGGKEITYYKRRKCKITFTIGDNTIVREIEQYPHILLPRGDHPYYQWGRKDPFVGSNLAYGNKPRWTYTETSVVDYGEGAEYNPPRLYIEPKKFQDNAGRKHTIQCLDVLIKNPDKWHNGPRTPDIPDHDYGSLNESFDDLWSNGGIKTIYDPCPAGYQVGDSTVFSGFTISGKAESIPVYWYDVLETNMSDYYDPSTVNSEVIQFYTSPRKLQCITFPITGYRDYDSYAQIIEYPSSEYHGMGFVWCNNAYDPINSYHFKYYRNNIVSGKTWSDADGRGSISIIDPSATFYNTDGFAVRPVYQSSPR